MEINVDLIRKAYKKLKSNVYFDKTQLKLRDDIVEFESNKNFENTFEDLLNALYDKSKYDALCQEIVGKVSYLSYPKSVKYERKEDRNSDAEVISNLPNDDVIIDKTQYFIDMDVKGHILGVLWIMLIGYRIDKQGYVNSYGNRIRKQLYNELSNQPTYSPYLFEPYFMQYESWRDKALDNAKKVLSNDQDVIIMTMDFKRFYYSVDVNKEAFELLYKDAKNSGEEWDDKNNTIYKRLNRFVYFVIEAYASLFYESNEFEKRYILPIGFLPSNVIANWCLKNFDKAVVDSWNPTYYGRYVDDILIIDKVEKNSFLCPLSSHKSLNKEDITNYFLLQCSKLNEISCKKENGILIKDKDKDNNNNIYYVNPLYGVSGKNKSNITLQNEKLKVYYFSSDETDALITCFQEMISKNKSEFRMMPEDDAVFQEDDYGEIYTVINRETINKFRGVDGIKIDKYKLSKFIGKYLRIGNLINDNIESRFERDVLKIFNSETIIDNYTIWEKILTVFVLNQNKDGLKRFLILIIDSINRIKPYKDVNNVEIIKNSLWNTLHSALSRCLSIICDNKFKEQISNEIKNRHISINFDNILKMSELYIRTHMTDKTLLPIPIDIIDLDKAYGSNCNLSIFNDVIQYISDTNKNFKQLNYLYFPYIVNMYEICIMTCINESLKDQSYMDLDTIIKDQMKYYAKTNYQVNKNNTLVDSEKVEKNTLINVGKGSKSKLQIAIANVSLSDNNLEKSFLNKPNRSYKRYSDIASLVNQAVQQNVDILVMPEAYVPFEWLQTLARTSARNKIAIITGVEHIIIDNTVYNYTAVILPYMDEEYPNAYISLHLKTHYAPSEVTEIHGYGLNYREGNGYELYHWNGSFFPVYCCYELTSIHDRSMFQAYADFIVAVEWNKDVNYYSNILESLSRDIHCYCIQANTSEYGDSRITMPSKTEFKDIIRTKGGNNTTILVGSIDVDALRKFQIKDHDIQKNDEKFKLTPPEFNRNIVKDKLRNEEIHLIRSCESKDLI